MGEKSVRVVLKFQEDYMIKPCPSYPGYCASDSGVIYSQRKRKGIAGRRGGSTVFIDPAYFKKLNPTTNRKGYAQLGIALAGSKTVAGAHQLIADAFHGPCPIGMVVRHLDDVKSNLHPSNLAYGTNAENAQDRVRNGGYKAGENHHSAKLSNDQALLIRQKRQAGQKFKSLALEFHVSVSTVEAIIYGKSYRAITFKRL